MSDERTRGHVAPAASLFARLGEALRPTPRIDLFLYAYAALYLGVLLVGTSTTWRPLTQALYFPLGAAAIAAAVFAARLDTLPLGDRRAWAWLAGGAFAYWVSGIIWTIRLNSGESAADTSPLLTTISAVCTITGLLQFPADARIDWRARRTQFDAALLAVAWLAMLWQFGVQPLIAGGKGLTFETAGGLLITWPELACAAWVYLRVGEHPRRQAIALYLFAAIVVAVTDFLWGEVQLRYLPGDWVDAPWFFAWLLRWHAARLAIRSRGHDRSALRGIAPTVFVVGTYLSLVVAVLLGRGGAALSLATAAVAMTALLLVRQRMELRETRAMAREAAASAARFRSLIEHASDFVFVVRPSFTMAFVSPSADRAGLTRLDGSFLDAIHPDERDTVQEWLLGADTARLPLRARILGNDRAWREIELRAHDQRLDARVGGWVVNGRDVAAEAGLERRLRHSQKLAALHDMAGRVAHAFNNALSSVLGHAELVSTEISDNAAWSEDVAQIRAAATRGAAITRQLLGFSDTHESQPVPIEVARLTGDLVATLERLLPPTVTLILSPTPPGLLVRADRSQLEQTIVNLVTNARDAMSGDGRIALRWTEEPSAEVALQVEDNGSGIPADALARVLDPFYTTKAPGHGTGLGLAMVDSMVRRAGGRVRIESTVGVGTTVRVFFPRTDAVIAPATNSATPARPSMAVRHAVVLVVDDEADVRRVSRRILERSGLTVLEADGGLAAIAIAQDLNVRVDVLVTDMMMPGTSGREVIEVFRQRRPGTPILCVTGFAAVGADGQPLADEIYGIVEKPFTASGLTSAVFSALASLS